MCNLSCRIFQNNIATGNAGAIALEKGGNVDITATTIKFIGNEGASNGGAIFNQDGQLNLLGKNNIFEGNRNSKAAEWKRGGGVIHTQINAANATVVIGADENSKNEFNRNTAVANGGAILVRSEGNGYAANTTFNGLTTFDANEAGANGAALYQYAKDTDTLNIVFVDDAIFKNNVAEGDGGAIYNFKENSGAANILFNGEVEFVKNSASENGGAIYTNDTVTFGDESSFVNNTADGNGGAIYTTADLTITDSDFEENKATGDGGAIYAKSSSDKINLTITETDFEKNTADFGGAIYSSQNVDLTIEKGEFENNSANWGGAIYTGTASGVTKILKAEFENNTALAGGAVVLMAKGELTDVTFTGNKATAVSSGAGAMFLGAESQTKITGGSFNANESAANGGAIAMREVKLGNNSGAKLDINGTKFDGNISVGNGGAIYSTFYNSEQKENNVAINGATFTNNKAKDGGAIYNEGLGDLAGNKAAMYIEGSTFSSNTATAKGGALFVAEGGIVELAGTNVFSGNKANGIANDIHNNGTLNVSGALTLDGGISADDGLGSVVFKADSSLTSSLKNSTIVANAVTIEDGAQLTLQNIAAGTYDFIVGSTTGTFTLADNALFDLVQNGSQITATTKSVEEIIANTGVSEDVAPALEGLGNASTDNEKAQAILQVVQAEIVAGNKDVVEKIVENINPTKAPVAQSVATEVNGQIMNLVGARLAPATGRAGGDYKIDAGGVWAKGLYSRAKQDAAFRGYTQGVAMGIDTIIEDVFTLGVGYAYSATDIKADARKTNVYGHNFFAYGEYQPNQWFVNTALSYSKSNYKEQKELVGTDAKYNVETYGAQAMTGYDFTCGLTPQAGLRYLHVKQDAHSDGLTYVDTDDTDLLTAVAGVNFAKDLSTKAVTFTPEVRLAATYDVVSDGAEANVILGSSSYTVSGKRLPRFGVEAGLGLQMSVLDKVDVNVDYDLSVRRDYTSHTGTVSLKYNF